MVRNHILIIVPGLGGENMLLRMLLRSWYSHGFSPHVIDVGWEEGKHFGPKLQRIVRAVDEIPKKKDYVSLLGISAGGSAVINTFAERNTRIHRVANICGRLRAGTHVFPTLAVSARTSPAFKESVLLSEKRLQQMSEDERKRILTLRPFFDEIVPVSTVTIPGATNKRIFSAEHLFSIASALTIHSRSIANFLTAR